MLQINDRVRILDRPEIEGIIIDVDRINEAVRIKVTSGRTPVTDYYFWMLEKIS